VQNHTQDLFQSKLDDRRHESLASGAWLLHGFALDCDRSLLTAVERIQADAPFRHLVTPGGFRMSVAMTNCGSLGWISDRRGYRYEPCDPATGKPWPAMPAEFMELARTAALAGGFSNFAPDACLINCYEPGTRLTLHQDRDECDFAYPIVSVSLGLPALFLFGGDNRSERQRRIPLAHGDVVVFGGASRKRHHGVAPVKEGHHELLGSRRLNLTFRRAR
jgi:alkylated DNA repair protein (DNA oxidative demethylase)